MRIVPESYAPGMPPPSILAYSVVCENLECEHFAEVRTVAAQHLGHGVYTAGALYCQCSWPLPILSQHQVDRINEQPLMAESTGDVKRLRTIIVSQE